MTDHSPATATTLDAFGFLDRSHRLVLQQLETLEQCARQLDGVEELPEPALALLGRAVASLDTIISIHKADEEQTLFPALENRPPFVGAQGTPMHCMTEEHVLHQRLMADLKRALMRLDGGAARRAALAIVEEYRSHIAKEDQILFPMARQMLPEHAVPALTEAMAARRRETGLLEV
jgi:hemerythrin-like domain-containing protein